MAWHGNNKQRKSLENRRNEDNMKIMAKMASAAAKYVAAAMSAMWRISGEM